MNKEIPAYVCSHVFSRNRPVLFVSRVNGDWQCLCGGLHESQETPKVIGLNHLLEMDQTLNEIMDLPPEWEAERASLGDPWLRTRVHAGY